MSWKKWVEKCQMTQKGSPCAKFRVSEKKMKKENITCEFIPHQESREIKFLLSSCIRTISS